MTTLADKSLLSGGDNKPPMLEKHLYDSWKSRMELYMLNRPHGRMILASVEKGPLPFKLIGNIKAINIILPSLPTKIYALVSQHRVAKDLWEKIKLLMQGTSLTKQERECKLYDEFDKFTYKKGESLHEYYLRFTLLLNDMNIYKMPLEPISNLHTTMFDQLHAYLQQHERHANEVRLMHEREVVWGAWSLLSQCAWGDRGAELGAVRRRGQLARKVRESKPKLYDGNVILKMDTIVIPDSDETLMLCEESRSKILLKEQDPMVVVKERTTATAITEGTWGFEHTKACFRDEIIPFIKELKDIFNNFNQYLVDELADVQNHIQAIDKDIVKTVVNLSVNASGETVTECQKCLELETELVKKKDFVDKETYDKLCKCFTTLEKHCITLEADSQLNQEIFQQENSVLNQNAPSFTQLFELSELKAQSQAKDTVIVKLKEQIKSLKGNVEDSSVKMDMDEIETLNIELEHRVTKLVTENEHLKQTYKQLYDSIKPKRVQSKEQCDALIKQVNIKSGEISDLNELRKLKGKAIDNEDTVTHSVDPKVSKDNMEPITPKLLNKRTAHSSYIKHTQEEALVLRDIVEHVKANYPQDPLLESAFRYTKVIQDLLSHISRSCPSINNCGPQLIEVIPRKKDKKVRFAESLTSTENTKPASTSNIVSNKRVLHSTGVRLSTSASGSQPSGNTKNDRILQTPSSNSKNKVEAHPRNVKSSLNKRNGTINVNGSAVVQNSKKQE
ncbi:hypothetical protein Tco_0365871 [Tanacetum coccineum]